MTASRAGTPSDQRAEGSGDLLSRKYLEISIRTDPAGCHHATNRARSRSSGRAIPPHPREGTFGFGTWPDGTRSPGPKRLEALVDALCQGDSDGILAADDPSGIDDEDGRVVRDV